LGLGLALKLAKEGNLVKFITKTGFIGSGYKQIKAYKSSETEEMASDIYIFTSPTPGNFWERAKRMGRVVVGDNKLLRNLLDHEFVKKASELLDIPFEPVGDGNPIFEVWRWFDGKDFYGPISTVIPYLRFMEGDKGVVTRGVGFVTKFIDDLTNTCMSNNFLGLLRKLEFFGYFGLRYSITEDKIVFKGFKREFPLGQLYTEYESMKFSLAEFLIGMSIGKPCDSKYMSGYNLGVQVSSPPYPYKVEGLSIPFYMLDIPHFYKEDFQSTPEGEIFRGENGVVGWSTAWGQKVREAQRRVYKSIDKVGFDPEIQYRRDIGEHSEDVFKQLGFEINTEQEAVYAFNERKV
jgi:hypothetical protein